MKDLWNLILGPQGLILIGGILTLIGAFWSANRDLSSERELNKKNEVIIKKTEKISELNDKIVNVLTGGDSFPYAMFGSVDEKQSIPVLNLMGENALRNVNGSFIDVRQLRKKQKEGNLMTNVGIDFNKNIISPAYVQHLLNETSVYDISQGGRFMIHFYTPYNTFTQHLAVEPNPKSGYPIQAFKIFKGNDKELVHTYYPEDFPIPLDKIDFLEKLNQSEIEEIRRKN